MNRYEEAMLMESQGCRLVGILSRPASSHPTGVLIVVGGPQYRAGSHRQFTLLARHLAERGIASLRFDYCGMGDSEGDRRSFAQAGPDLRTAIDCFLQHAPELTSVVIWGLCDAASAALLYAPDDPRVSGLVLLNPWTENLAFTASARLKKYYPSRLRDSAFWGKALRLEVNLTPMIRDFVWNIAQMSGAHRIGQGGNSSTAGMLDGLLRFQGDIVVILSERDLTAQAFNLLVKNDAAWRSACQAKSVVFREVAQADHTFSTRTWRDEVAAITADFVLRPVSKHPAGLPPNIAAREWPRAELVPFDRAALAPLEQAWVQLEDQAESSFFQSWTWMRAWLTNMPNADNISILKVRAGDDTVALALLGRGLITRHRLLRVRSLLLTETGDPGLDSLTIEHNDLLIRRGWEIPAWQSTLDLLAGTPALWDEFRVSGLSNPRTLETILAHTGQLGLRASTELSNRYFWVDMERIRQNNTDYLGNLSSNTRQQIRKAIKLYTERGPLGVARADTLEQARVFFEELKQLHQAHWLDKGHPGAFATPFANAFHHALIEQGFGQGQIQLLRITAGSELVGLLYNFVYRGIVTNYQAGFVYDENPKLKPGLVCHTLAIEMNLNAGHKLYDFLMGESQYKRSLSNHDEVMYWLTVQRPLLKFRVESAARAFKTVTRRYLSKLEKI